MTPERAANQRRAEIPALHCYPSDLDWALAQVAALRGRVEQAEKALAEIEAECDRRREIGGISNHFVRNVLARAAVSADPEEQE